MNACASGRLRGPGPNDPSRRCDRQQVAESFELVGESGVKPRAAGAVHGAGEDHQHPRQPLGDIASVGRHGDAGPGFDCDTFGGAHSRGQPRQLGLGDIGERRGVFERERLNRGGQRVDTLNRHIGLHAVAQNFAHQIGQHRVVGAGARSQMAGGQSGGLRAPRIDHPHLPALGDVTHRARRVGHRDRMAMGHNRIDADEHQKVGAVEVGSAGQPHESTHQIRDQRFGGAVDGQRAELGRSADRRVQGFGHPESGALHGAEVEGDRLRPMTVDDALQPRAQVVEAGIPCGVLQPAAHPHLRPFKTVGMVVHLRQRTTLRAHVTV